ncbi:MAG: hypothetical protein AAGB34_11590, partial [Planctomycetota bacterium]
MLLLSTVFSLVAVFGAVVPSQVERIREPGILLERIESVDNEIDTYSATVMYQRFFSFQGDQQTRQGTLYYERKKSEAVPAGPPVPGNQREQSSVP